MTSDQLSNDLDLSFSMTWDDFVKHCEDFVKISDKLNDGWFFSNIRNNLSLVGESYLIKKTVRNFDSYLNAVIREECVSDCISVCSESEVTNWEYHILYSPSYCVPTLYFNVWKRDGTILSMDEINKLKETQECAACNKVCVVSQHEHPLLHRPFYYIHPCDTAAILKSCKTIMSNTHSVNPITTWLSTIASVAHIVLPSDYAC